MLSSRERTVPLLYARLFANMDLLALADQADERGPVRHPIAEPQEIVWLGSWVASLLMDPF
jgi:hypothetical protein